MALRRIREALLGQRRVAFVLSGGGSLGAIQVGMLRALADEGIRPDVIVGCSVGAINGAAYAAEPGIRGLNRLDRIWRRLANGTPDLMPSGILPFAAQMARKGTSVHDPATLRQLLDEELSVETFEELEIPFACVATSLDDADEHWFDEGQLKLALMASAALPAIYPPVEIGGSHFIDGGVVREAPVAQAAEMGAEVIYLLHVGRFNEIRTAEIERPFDAALQAYWIARYRRFEEDLESLSKNCDLIRLPTGSEAKVRVDDFSYGPKLADRSHVASREFLRTGVLVEPIPIGSGIELSETVEG